MTIYTQWITDIQSEHLREHNSSHDMHLWQIDPTGCSVPDVSTVWVQSTCGRINVIGTSGLNWFLNFVREIVFSVISSNSPVMSCHSIRLDVIRCDKMQCNIVPKRYGRWVEIPFFSCHEHLICSNVRCVNSEHTWAAIRHKVAHSKFRHVRGWNAIIRQVDSIFNTYVLLCSVGVRCVWVGWYKRSAVTHSS